MRLKDEVAIVTGGGRGIGRHYALALAREGAKVIIAEIAYESAQETAREIESAGGEALAVKTDVSSQASVEEMVKKASERFGRIDVLVNNAAIMFRFIDHPRQPFDQFTEEEWDRVMAVNVKGMFLCAKAAVPFMKRQAKGKIINISSGTIWQGGLEMVPYVTSKAAVVGFTRALARELGDFGINVNAVTPGLTQSETVRELFPQRSADLAAQQCIKRKEEPDDLVGTIVFLASEESNFITGQTINVDGGWCMH